MRNRLYDFLRVLVNIYVKVFVRYLVKGEENIPQTGSAIICANHIHLFDPLAIGVNTPRYMFFMAKKDLFKSKLGNWFFTKLGAIPVSRDCNDAYSLKKALEVINKGELLGIFPEGTREKGSGALEYKPGVSMLAVRTSTPVIPVYINGSYKLFSKLSVNIGTPIDLSEYKGKKLSTDEYTIIANDIIAKSVLSLKEN